MVASRSSVGRRAPRPPRAGPAGRGDGASWADALRGAGGEWQDDDARRPGRLAHRVRRGDGRRDRRDHVQQARRRGAPRAACDGARRRSGCRRRGRRGPRPNVPRARPRNPARCRADRRAAGRSDGRSCGGSPRRRPGRLAGARHGDLAPQAGPGRRRPTRSRPIPRRARSPGPSSRTRPRSRRPAASTSTTSSRGRSVPSRPTPRCSSGGAVAARTSSSTRRRTSIAPSSGWRCCWPRPRTASSSSATTTSRSTAGALPTSAGSSSLDDALPGLRRVDLEVNYRCPPTVVARAVRLVEHNRERFAKAIRAGPAATGPIVLAPDSSDETVRIGRVFDSWPTDDATRGRSSPGRTASFCRRFPSRSTGGSRSGRRRSSSWCRHRSSTPSSPRLTARPIRACPSWPGSRPSGPGGARRHRRAARREDDPDGPRRPTSPRPSSPGRSPTRASTQFRAAVAARRAALAELCRDDAALTLATAHGTKGLEFDHVAVIGLDAGRFPSRRSVTESEDPGRALEEERRLAYVAWTRARRSLTLVYDPLAPSEFLLEAFSPDELGVEAAA